MFVFIDVKHAHIIRDKSVKIIAHLIYINISFVLQKAEN
jgi:hypothetical protein